MKKLATFISAVLAGAAISIGGAVFLCTESRTAGAALFSVGLFAVCTLGLDLFTGKVCYIFQNPPGLYGPLRAHMAGEFNGDAADGEPAAPDPAGRDRKGPGHM